MGREIRVLDYYEAQGQPLSEHIGWVFQRGYEKALMVLPHDGATKDRVYNVSFESALQQAGFQTKIVPHQGVGAVKMRIEAVRRLFPAIWFNRETTKAGEKHSLGITKNAMNSAISVWAPNMIGLAMVPIVSDSCVWLMNNHIVDREKMLIARFTILKLHGWLFNEYFYRLF